MDGLAATYRGMARTWTFSHLIPAFSIAACDGKTMGFVESEAVAGSPAGKSVASALFAAAFSLPASLAEAPQARGIFQSFLAPHIARPTSAASVTRAGIGLPAQATNPRPPYNLVFP